jgi:hypothetical protein
MVRAGGAERLEQPDFAGTLGDGDEHDVHDQDAGHRQADRGNAGDAKGQGAEQAVESGQDGILGDHRDVLLAAMTLLE